MVGFDGRIFMATDNSAKNSPPQAQVPFWTGTRILITIVTLLLLAAVGVSSWWSAEESAKVGPSTTTGTTDPGAPEASVPSLPPSVLEAELPGINGRSIKLSNYAGKVVLVNLWATWCGPCRMETPALVKLHKEYRSKGLAMVGLSTEHPEASAELVRDFVRHYNVDYPIGWATREVQLSLMQLSGRNAIPQSFIIGPDGRVLDRFIGFSQQHTPGQLRQAIEAALNGTKAD